MIRRLLVVVLLAGAGGCSTSRPQARRDVSALREFAVSWEPASTEEHHIPVLPAPTLAVSRLLENGPIDEEYCQSVTLVLLKLHRFYLENCHQSYDLRCSRPLEHEANAFFGAFARMARLDADWQREGESVSSGMVEDWLDLHPYYLRNEVLRSEANRIEQTTKNTQAGVFWK